MTGEPAADDLKRGYVVLAPDPCLAADETTRPWVVVNDERMPFDNAKGAAGPEVVVCGEVEAVHGGRV